MAFSPLCRDAGLLGAAKAIFEGAAYTERPVCEALGLATLGQLSSDRFGRLAARLEAVPGALRVLVRLLLIEAPVPRREAEAALGREAVDRLSALGLVAGAGPRMLRAAVSVYPCGGALIVTDHRLRGGAGGPRRRQERVMYLGADSYLLASLAEGAWNGGPVLDLCTGSGVHAILAALRGAQAVGIDISPRAVAFARFNARLNGVDERCTFLTGDLYRPLAGRAFPRPALVLANPPFVPSPRRGATRTLFSEGGELGDDVLARMIRGLERRLSPGGVAVVVSAFTDARSDPFETRLSRWIGPRTRLRGIVLVTDRATPEQIAAAHTAQATRHGYRLVAAARGRWLEAYRAAGIEGVRGGALALACGADWKGPLVRTVEVGASWRPDGSALRRALFADCGVPGPVGPGDHQACRLQ